MATCVKCGKPIGLLEYALGDSKQLGLCKTCRTKGKWCDDCVYMLTISMEDSSVIRCIKYGYNLSNKKDWKTAANCQDFTPKIEAKDQKQGKNTKNNKTTPLKRAKKESRSWF